ncbi:YbaN family protein [Sediminibacillus massiliensis]|uniref:YbaN family protein n=1 Tax=Sediminibacillus massiliensis TaxID=1926277 RepID=UPI001FE25F15|nr:YbaN family protein [Sediminibacillus massiliensis]
MTIKKLKSILFLLLGFLSLMVGVAGTVLPVLPGGPFYLFAAYCFAKGSRRMENWLKNTKLYKKYAEAFIEKKGLSRKEKIRINLIADFFIIISIVIVEILPVQILLAVLALFKHYYFIKKIKTIS